VHLGAEDLQPSPVVIGELRRTGRGVRVVALPSNQKLQLTGKSVTPFAYAKRAPLFPAAHAVC